MVTIYETYLYAREAHDGQLDKGGVPYIGHVVSVFHRTMDILMSTPLLSIDHQDFNDTLRAALLHDVVEDTPITLDDLRAFGFSEGTVRRVARLTGRPEGVTYLQNIRNIVSEGDIGVIAIKLADNEDNSNPLRIAQLPIDQQGIVQRYERSKKILREALDDHIRRG